MKYKVGDKVRIKSLDWYNKNKGNIDKTNNVWCEDGSAWFFYHMSQYCGKIMTITNVWALARSYTLEGSDSRWTDEMIEGLVEEETKPNIIEEAKTYWDSIKDAWICPEGYIFKDENGNVINATKIVLEKKKKEFPKTYEECCEVLNTTPQERCQFDFEPYGGELYNLHRLLICRDAYWKIAGEEMGLGKPWEPDWSDASCSKYIIDCFGGEIYKGITAKQNTIFAFPTEEMRDAFKENFDPDIEICKELL